MISIIPLRQCFRVPVCVEWIRFQQKFHFKSVSPSLPQPTVKAMRGWYDTLLKWHDFNQRVVIKVACVIISGGRAQLIIHGGWTFLKGKFEPYVTLFKFLIAVWYYCPLPPRIHKRLRHWNLIFFLLFAAQWKTIDLWINYTKGCGK